MERKKTIQKGNNVHFEKTKCFLCLYTSCFPHINYFNKIVKHIE